MDIGRRRSPTGAASGTVQLNRGHALRLLGRLDEALDAYVLALPSAFEGREPRLRVSVLAGQALAWLEAGRVADAQAAMRAAEETLRAHPLVPHAPALLLLRTAEATLLERQGRPARADALLADIEALYAHHLPGDGQGSLVTAQRSALARARGDVVQAAALGRLACERAQRLQADLPRSVVVARACHAWAQALHAQSDTAALREAAALAAAQLAITLGERHASTLQAKAWATTAAAPPAR